MQSLSDENTAESRSLLFSGIQRLEKAFKMV